MNVDQAILARISAYGNWKSMEAFEQNLKDGMNVEGPPELRTCDMYALSPLAYELLYSNHPTVSESATLFVKHGADVNAKCLVTDKTILVLAMERGQLIAIDFLLKHGASSNIDGFVPKDDRDRAMARFVQHRL